MFKALKNLFTTEEEETEVQKNEENDQSSADNTLEENPMEEPEEEEIVIFPDTDLTVGASKNETVMKIANSLYSSSKDGDGTLKKESAYIFYEKSYPFATVNWIIIDTSIERIDKLKKALKDAVKKEKKEVNGEIKTEWYTWHISENLNVQPLTYIEKNFDLLKLKANILFKNSDNDGPDKYQTVLTSFDLTDFKTKVEGYFSILLKLNKYRGYGMCLVFFKTKEDLLKHYFSNHYSTYEDPFTNNTIFKWDSIGTPSDEYLNLIQEQLDKGFEPRTYITLDHWLYFKLKNVNGVDFITFEFRIKEMKLRADDSIFFLLSNGEVIEFRLPKKFYTIEPRVLKGVDVPITQEELITLSKHEVEKVRVHEKKSNFKVDIEITDYINQWDMYKEYRQYVIRNLFADHLEQVENIIDGYKPLVGDERTVEEQNNEPCHVYLMKDQANDFFKIGISNKPNYRERTLQSEKPTIDLIASKEFPSRTIAESIERALHDSYSDKRLRGEWFDLNPKDINDIKKTLK